MSLEVLPSRVHWDVAPKQELAPTTKRRSITSLTKSFLVKNVSKVDEAYFWVRGPQSDAYDLPLPEDMKEDVVYRPYTLAPNSAQGFSVTYQPAADPNSALGESPAWIDTIIIFEELKAPVYVSLTAAHCSPSDAAQIFVEVQNHFNVTPPSYLAEKHNDVARQSLSTIAESIPMDEFIVQQTEHMDISDISSSSRVDDVVASSRRSSRTSANMSVGGLASHRSTVTTGSRFSSGTGNDSIWHASIGRPPTPPPREFQNDPGIKSKPHLDPKPQVASRRRNSVRMDPHYTDDVQSVISATTDDGKNAFFVKGVGWCKANGEVIKRSSSPLAGSMNLNSSRLNAGRISKSNSPVTRHRAQRNDLPGREARRRSMPKDPNENLPELPKFMKSMNADDVQANWDSIPGI